MMTKGNTRLSAPKPLSWGQFKTKSPKSPTSSKGVALVVVLVFMLALSIMAVFSSRNATMGERQARNELEFQIARQAAEAALRDAEIDLRIPEPNGLFQLPGAPCSRAGSLLRAKGVAGLPSAEFTDACLAGQCGVPNARYAVTWATATPTNRGAPWWPTTKGGLWGNKTSVSDCTAFTGGVPLGTFTGATAITGVARQPEYLIELLTPETTPGGVQDAIFECTGKANSGASQKVLSSQDESTGGTAGAAKGSCYVFRITARGFGASTRTALLGGQPDPLVEVVLQSYFQLFVK